MVSSACRDFTCNTTQITCLLISTSCNRCYCKFRVKETRPKAADLEGNSWCCLVLQLHSCFCSLVFPLCTKHILLDAQRKKGKEHLYWMIYGAKIGTVISRGGRLDTDAVSSVEERELLTCVRKPKGNGQGSRESKFKGGLGYYQRMQAGDRGEGREIQLDLEKRISFRAEGSACGRGAWWAC